MKIAKLLISFLLLALSSCANLYSKNISKSLDKLLSENQQASIAVKAIRLSDNKEIYGKNAYRLLIPASNIKLLTAYTALLYLTPEFKYNTQIIADKKKISNNILDDNLYIKFSGDPGLTSDDLTDMVNSLANYNIYKIKGKIIIDDRIFDQIPLGKGWAWDDNNFCYSALITAATINRNCFKIKLGHVQDKVNVTILDPGSIEVINEVELSEDKQTNLRITSSQNNQYLIKGYIKVSSEPIVKEIAVQNPRRIIKDIIYNVLKNQNIVFGSPIEFGQTPKNVDVLAEHKSPALKNLLKIMLKDSDNLIAENVVKTMGARYHNAQGNFDNGTEIIREILKSKLGDNFRLVDGSGLSRYNLISANHLIKLLQAAYQEEKVWNYLFNSLPISGIDGTLKNRLLKYDLKNKVYAKTGGMEGVSNLSGYLNSRFSGLLAFSVLINGFIGSDDEVKKLQEEIIFLLSKY